MMKRGDYAQHHGGLIKSNVAGRTDRLPMSIAPESHVIPADVVSGLGQGNTLAGSEILDKLVKAMPAGTKRIASHGGMGVPHGKLALGGRTKPVPVIVAGGEYVVSPEAVRALGSGSVSEGHRILDKMILAVRKQTIAHMKKLPKPKK